MAGNWSFGVGGAVVGVGEGVWVVPGWASRPRLSQYFVYVLVWGWFPSQRQDDVYLIINWLKGTSVFVCMCSSACFLYLFILLCSSLLYFVLIPPLCFCIPPILFSSLVYSSCSVFLPCVSVFLLGLGRTVKSAFYTDPNVTNNASSGTSTTDHGFFFFNITEKEKKGKKALYSLLHK